MRQVLLPSLLITVALAVGSPAPGQVDPERTDLCGFEGDAAGVGSAPVCDALNACSIDRYTCRLNARRGYYKAAHLAFCGPCIQPFSVTAQAQFLSGSFDATSVAAGSLVDGPFERVNVTDSGGEAAGGGSLAPALSADGRFAAFDSTATNLVPGDTNGRRDVFVYDRTTRLIERVSVASNGAQGNGDSIAAAVTDDGRFVAFLSQASNLVAGDTNGLGDVFVHDRQTRVTERVNVGPGGVQARPAGGAWGLPAGSWPSGYQTTILANTEVAISGDGRYVAFVSDADNLLGSGGDLNNLPDVFVRDRQSGVTSRVSVWSSGQEIRIDDLATMSRSNALDRPRLALSADGRFVAFDTNLAAESTDTNNRADVYLHDRQSAQTTRISVGANGVQGNGYSGWPSISGDGRYVVFASEATNLVSGAARRGVYLRDRDADVTTQISAVPRAFAPVISRDGRRVAFASWLFGNPRIESYDRLTGFTGTVSHPSATVVANGSSFGASINATGTVIAFASEASNLVSDDLNGHDDIFVAVADTPVITRQPEDATVMLGQTAHFSVEAIGSANLTFQWQFFNSVTQAWAEIPPATSSTYSVNVNFESQNGSRFRCVLSNWAGRVTSAEATVTIVGSSAPTITQHPANRSVIAGQSTQFTVAASGSPAPSYRWQISTNGGTIWTNLVNASPYSGVSTAVLTIGTASIDLDGNRYRAVAMNTAGSATSNAGTLSVVGGTTVALDRTALRFGAISNGVTFLTHTSTQTVRLTQSGAGPVTWIATASAPWLTVTPSSGSGSATLFIDVTFAGGLPSNGSINGTVAFSFAGAANTAGPVNVQLTVRPPGMTQAAFGVVDTPLEGSTGVSGAVPFTGWALDDIEVTRVTVCRAIVVGESADRISHCGGAAQILIGEATFVDGARPDVQTFYPLLPRSSRAGWGFMVLTNMLPDVARGLPTGGNGTYTFFVYAHDREGNVSFLSTRTLTCENDLATKPFGAIDTPEQGAVVSGAAYVNFGWALTPNPKVIPTDGSTITVFIDGVPLGNVSYNHFRSDIAGFFPGLANSEGAVGFRVIDTTALSNGVHTIAWGVTDNTGAGEGIGSRYFTVSNGAASAASERVAEAAVAELVEPVVGNATGSSDPRQRASQDVDALPADGTPIAGRRGFDAEAPLREHPVTASGHVVVRGEELDRFELRLRSHGSGDYTGHLRVGTELAPLPIGSRLDPATGVFTWAAGVGFAGTYDLVFVRSVGGRGVSRQEVRLILAPKGSTRVGPQVVIDTPRAQQDVGQPFLLAGWAADLSAAVGTGMDTLHVWAYPLTGEAPIFLGVAEYGGSRPDVAAVHGEQFRDSAYGLVIEGLVPGNYDIAVFAWSNVLAGFVPATTVRVTVR